MKNLRLLATGAVAAALIGLSSSLSAQTISRGVAAQIVDDTPLQPQLMQPEDVPLMGTFYMISDFQDDTGAPPYPYNPFFGAAVYSTRADGTFIVDDSEARPERFRPVQNVDLATLDIWTRVETFVDSVKARQLARSNAALNRTTLSSASGSTMLMSTATVSLDPGVPGDGSGTNTLPEMIYAAPTYGSNDLWLEITGVTNGVVALNVHGTVSGVQYEILSKGALEATSGWSSEGAAFIGLDGVTTATVSMGSRTSQLFFWARSWQDSNGSGLPDWWQTQWFGSLGVDPYGDADGDGWNNLQEYQNGTNPKAFNTPAAPQGFTVRYNSSSGLVTLKWTPSSGPVTGYSITRIIPETAQQTVFNFSADTHEFLDTFPLNNPDPIGGNTYSPAPPKYTIQAHYTTGDSDQNSAMLFDSSRAISAGFARGTDGRVCLAVLSPVPSDTAFIRVNRYHIEQLNHLVREVFDLPAATLTNGVLTLPDICAEPVPSFPKSWVQTVSTDSTVSAANFVGRNLDVTSFYDGRHQLKQNLNFLLRTSHFPFRFTILDDISPYRHLCEYPEEYTYAGLTYYESQSVSVDQFLPFGQNYIFRNFVFTEQDIDSEGALVTGVAEWANFEGGLCLTNPAKYQFSVPTGTQIPAILDDNTARWAFTGWWDDLGLAPPSLDICMSNPVVNGFGLPYLSVRFGYGIDGISRCATVYSGQCIPGYDGDFPIDYGTRYYETAIPDLETVGYYFGQLGRWKASFTDPGINDPLPGSVEFSNTIAAPFPFICGLGKSIKLVGYAKQRIKNGYPDKFGYLGQYFEKAYALDTNGVATGTEAGVVSPYGDFVGTRPGPVGVVTMTNWGVNERGTGIVHVVGMVVDFNHDGMMDFTVGGSDATSEASPLAFWVNNDYDRSHPVDCIPGPCVIEEDDVSNSDPDAGCPAFPTRATQDCDYQRLPGLLGIPCKRDLEDYTRLWIPGILKLCQAHPELNFELSIRTNNAVDGPAINLFQATESDGGNRYLTDEASADVQMNAQVWMQNGRVQPGSIVFLNNQLGLPDASDYFIFCGVKRGKGEIVLQIKSGTNILAETSTWIELKDVKEMYERWTVGDNGSVAPTNTAYLAADGLVPGTMPFQYSQAAPTNTPYILHVHGWNMNPYDKDRYAETAFKRLYWQGFQGRFGEFRWPTYFDFPSVGGQGGILNNYDKSEQQAWKSAAGLRNLLVKLNEQNPGQVRISAHSMGNIVVGEALRTNIPLVHTYAATEAAVPSHCYDSSTPARSLGVAEDYTPNAYANYWNTTNSCYFSVSAGANHFVNFFNTNDFALVAWQTDQNLKPADSLGYEFFPISGFFKHGTDFLEFPNDTFELFSFCIEARCYALGAQAGVGGAFTPSAQVDLAAPPYSFGSAHIGHSAQFRSTNMKRGIFWEQLLDSFGIVNP